MENGRVCSVCGKKGSIVEISDHVILAATARNDYDINSRIKEAEKLGDKFLISYLNEVLIADNAKISDYYGKHYAVKKITDQAFLADIAKNASHISARKYACCRNANHQAALAKS